MERRYFMNYEICTQMDTHKDEYGNSISDEDMKENGYTKVSGEEFDRYFND